MFLILLPLTSPGQGAFTDYGEVQQLLALMAEVLPSALKSTEASSRRQAWSAWITGHDREIRSRLLRGDEDTLINWLLFGTSFTGQPRAYFDAVGTTDDLRKRIAQRSKDLVAALVSPDMDERTVFARQLLRARGYGFDTVEEKARLERHLYTEVDRVVAERQQYMRAEEAAADDPIGGIMAQSSMFQDRGLSLDTSILASFAIQEALKMMKSQGLLAPFAVRRIAVIGPGLDFADKNSGYDFYPVQTMQPFTSIDSLVRLGLAARLEEVEVTTFDISPRVNNHIGALRDRGRSGAPYVVRLPTEPEKWMPELVRYWKSIGDRIGSETLGPSPPVGVNGIEIRGIAVLPQVAARIKPVDFNMVTERWKGSPFDLVIATNVLVYYDKLDQALAFSSIEAMLRPGGFFLTNNVVVELPVSQLRSIGLMTVQHSAEKVDHLFWYRRGGPVDSPR